MLEPESPLITAIQAEDITQTWNEERRCYTVAETKSYWVDVIPMIYNHRVVLTLKDHPMGCYEHGWCFPTLIDALFSLVTWNPAIESDIPGAIKRATPFPRALDDL